MLLTHFALDDHHYPEEGFLLCGMKSRVEQVSVRQPISHLHLITSPIQTILPDKVITIFQLNEAWKLAEAILPSVTIAPLQVKPEWKVGLFFLCKTYYATRIALRSPVINFSTGHYWKLDRFEKFNSVENRTPRNRTRSHCWRVMEVKWARTMVVGDHRNRVPTVELIETNCIRFCLG